MVGCFGIHNAFDDKEEEAAAALAAEELRTP
jgi:hypothetical protein